MNPKGDSRHRANDARPANATTPDAATTVNSTDIAPVLQLRRQAAMLCAPAECGCADPWVCRCLNPKAAVTDKELDAFRSTLLTLLDAGMTPMPSDIDDLRALWRRGGEDRKLAQYVAQRLGVAA